VQRAQLSVADVSVLNPLERGEYTKLLGELEVRQ